MIYSKNNNKKKYKAFTLIELVVVMAIIAILVLLSAPKFMGYISRANNAKIISNIKTLEDATELYYMDNDVWPKIADTTYTTNDIMAMAASVIDKTGNSATLDPDGTYYLINYDELKNYVSKPNNADKYVLQNPVGSVYYLKSNNSQINNEPQYVLATDKDFTKETNVSAPNGYYYQYIGTAEYVEVPAVIQGDTITDTYRMFFLSPVKGVKINNPNITSMSNMFAGSTATSLNLSSFNTSNITNMNHMFFNSKATSLDLSSFDTSNVTSMYCMFYQSRATSLNLSSFDTSNVTNMSYMFFYSRATSLNLSSFDTSNVTLMTDMFNVSLATTGYAKAQTDADKFNTSSNKPATLNFVVK